MPHTPGPYGPFDNGNNTHNIVSYGGGRTGLVAVTFHLPVSPENDEETTEQANSKLLAAAPDLLAACKAASTDLLITADHAREVAKTDNRWCGVADQLTKRREQVEAAIAKAGGAA